MKVLGIAGTGLRRQFRDRSSFFFVFILPIALIMLIGAQFGGSFAPVVGVVGSGGDPLADAVLEEIRSGEGYEIREFDSREGVITAVERGHVSAGLIIPVGFTQAIASGETPEISFAARPDTSGIAVRSAIEGAITEALGEATAARSVSDRLALPFDEALDVVNTVAPTVSEITVETRTIGNALFPATMGQFDLGASSQLVLFTFLTALTGSAALIQSRQLGVTRRMLSTGTATRTIIIGEATGRWGVAVFQGLDILIVTLVAFGVDWGDPLGAMAVLLAFGLVGAAGAMLMGAVFSNDQQAGGVAVVLGIGLAALGGSMAPLEIFSPTMRQVAFLTPHAWANDAFGEMVRRDGTLVDVLPQIGVLLGYAAILFAMAAVRLRRVITR